MRDASSCDDALRVLLCCSTQIKLNLGAPDVRVFTFGSPRVGNAIFAEWYESKVQVRAPGSQSGSMAPLLVCCAPPGWLAAWGKQEASAWAGRQGFLLVRLSSLQRGTQLGHGPQVFAADPLAHLNMRQAHYRFTHNRDIVPSVPPTYMGFHHVSREVRLLPPCHLPLLQLAPLPLMCGCGRHGMCTATHTAADAAASTWQE